MDKKGRKFRVTLEELIQDVEKYQAHTRIKQDGRIVRESLSDHTELTLKYFQTMPDFFLHTERTEKRGSSVTAHAFHGAD